MEENGLTQKKKKKKKTGSRRYPTETMTDKDGAGDLTVLVITHSQAESPQQSQELPAKGNSL